MQNSFLTLKGKQTRHISYPQLFSQSPDRHSQHPYRRSKLGNQKAVDKASAPRSTTLNSMANPYAAFQSPNGYGSESQGHQAPQYGYPDRYAPSPDVGRRTSQSQGYGSGGGGGGGGSDYHHDQDLRQPTRGSHHQRRQSRYSDDDDSDQYASSEEDEQRLTRRSARKSNKHHKSASSRSKSRVDKAKEQFSKSDRGVGAGMVGAVAGAVIAQETAQRNGKGSIGATIAGLLIGGLAGNVLERQYDK